MQIFIKTRTGKQVVLEARYTDTVASVKAQIRDKEGIPPAQQCLIYDRMVLDDGRTLAGCGVQRESTIHLELPGTMGSGSQMGRRTTASESRYCAMLCVVGVASLCLSVAALVHHRPVDGGVLDSLQQLQAEQANLLSKCSECNAIEHCTTAQCTARYIYPPPSFAVHCHRS